MSTAAAPVRPLDDASPTELRPAAEQILTAALGEPIRIRRACRPVDTDDGPFVLRRPPVDAPWSGPTPASWATAAGIRKGKRLKHASARLPGRRTRPPAAAAEHGCRQPAIEAYAA